jgi:2-polyprenyl-6-methoxyphenol hydroxylase-like FAD-dependent oxidoreductase
MAGLALALALEGSGKRVVIVERDHAPPPDLSPNAAFEEWKRPGVSQFRYPHVFVGRLQGLLRTRYPKLFQELADVGFRTSTFSEGLAPSLRAGYVPEPGDVLTASLCGRRATLEYVLHRYVARMPHVRFEYGAVAQGLAAERVSGALQVVGVEIKRAEAREVLRGDVVVDAAGRNSQVKAWVDAIGGKLDVKQELSHFVYFCRHFHLREGEQEPDHHDVSADLDYLKYAIFYAEHGHFAIAFGCGEEEADLLALIRSAEGFDSLCRQIPALARWVTRAEPVTKVLGAAKIQNRCSRIASTPRMRGRFLTGDSSYEANPIYGRGCAAAFVQSHLLAEALVAEADHARRMARYEAGLQAELMPYHRASVFADRLFHARADRARGVAVGALQRLQVYGYEKVVVPAVLINMAAAREIINVMAMGRPAGPMRALMFFLRVVRIWLSPRSRAAQLPPGPERGDLLQRASAAVPASAPESASAG